MHQTADLPKLLQLRLTGIHPRFSNPNFTPSNTLKNQPSDKIRTADAELVIGDSLIMLALHLAHDARSPQAFGALPVSLHFYVKDVEGMAARATPEPGQNRFTPLATGDRSGTFEDPFGHVWRIARRIEDVPPEEIGRRTTAAMNKLD